MNNDTIVMTCAGCRLCKPAKDDQVRQRLDAKRTNATFEGTCGLDHAWFSEPICTQCRGTRVHGFGLAMRTCPRCKGCGHEPLPVFV